MYDEPSAKPTPALVNAFDPYDDYILVPQDKQELYDQVDYSFGLDLKMDNLGDGANYAFFNDVSYVEPKVPTLYSVLSTGGNASDPVVYGSNTNAFVLQKDQVVEIVLNNDDAGKHPFHLHGKHSCAKGLGVLSSLLIAMAFRAQLPGCLEERRERRLLESE